MARLLAVLLGLTLCVAMVSCAPLTLTFSPMGDPPADCPQKLAAAKKAITDADNDLNKANAQMNKTVPQLNAEVQSAEQAQQEANDEFKAATDKYNADSNKLNADDEALKNAQANLTNIQNECCCGDVTVCDKTKCVPPSNCDELEKEATNTVQDANTTYCDEQNQVNQDATTMGQAQQYLDEKIAQYKAAVAYKNQQIQKLNDAINAAKHEKDQAVSNYNKVAQECAPPL